VQGSSRSSAAQSEGPLFGELCTLAECYGFVHDRTTGSHHIYKRPGYMKLLNFQNVRGTAKPYQVRQLLAAIEEIGRSEREE